MSILLTPDERCGVIAEWHKQDPSNDPHYLLLNEMIAKAQARKIIEWGGKPCPHYHLAGQLDRLGNVIPNKPRRTCNACWQALQDELEV